MRIELDERGNFVFVETGLGGGAFTVAVDGWGLEADTFMKMGLGGDGRTEWAKAAPTRALDRMIRRKAEIDGRPEWIKAAIVQAQDREIARLAEIVGREAKSKFFALSALGDMGGMWLYADVAAAGRCRFSTECNLARRGGIVFDEMLAFDFGLARRTITAPPTRPTWAGRLGRRSLWKALERKATPELVTEDPRSILPLDASRDRHRLGPTSTAAPRQRPAHRRGRGPGPARRRNTRRQ